MSAYKEAVDRIHNHYGYLDSKSFDQKFLLNANPDSMAEFIKLNGCLITQRHDLNRRFSGRDYLVNMMTDLVVLHIDPKGHYTLHHWEKSAPCSQANRIAKAKEKYLITKLLEAENV